MNQNPPRPTGTTPEARYAQWLWDSSNRNRIQDSAGSRTTRTTRGFFTIPQKLPGGIKITTWHLKSVSDEYLVCRSWDGENEGTQDVKIAKPSKLRSSIDEETIDGTLVTYTNYDAENQTRHASAGVAPNTTEEDQVIVPRYLQDDVIYAVKAKTMAADEDGKDIALMDLNIDGRAWAATS